MQFLKYFVVTPILEKATYCFNLLFVVWIDYFTIPEAQISSIQTNVGAKSQHL